MAENENTVVTEEVVPQPAPESEKPSFGKRLWGGIKEWCRKSVVKLKRRPMNIAFFVLIVSTLVNLCSLGSYSQLGLNPFYNNESQGLCIFICQLFCILVLLLFMNSFPKRSKKPKIVMLVLTFVFMAVMIGLDIYLYISWGNLHVKDLAIPRDDDVWLSYWETGTGMQKGVNTYYPGAMGGLLAHLILVGIAALLTATYPLYGKLINKINTRKVIESTELKEEIDTSAEV
ncbi:MAG: hypothetical protein K2N33_00390 [Clostridia bacterium]|nr:hypothetical protein [Clostridia bacterium]